MIESLTPIPGAKGGAMITREVSDVLIFELHKRVGHLPPKAKVELEAREVIALINAKLAADKEAAYMQEQAGAARQRLAEERAEMLLVPSLN
jgi:hypothetical protein